MEKIKLPPYGISNYRQIKRDGLYMVDKTMYLEKMELAGNFLFLIRPRRFGKSVFLSMLESYYDIETKDDFDMLFGDTYVGEHPTEIRNQFQVLRIDFSKPSGSVGTLQENVEGYLDVVYEAFANKYAKY